MEAKCVPILQVRVRTEPQGLSGVHLCAGHMPVNTAPVSMDPWRSQEIPRRRSGGTGRAVPHRCPRQCPAWSRIRFPPGEERESARRRFLPQDGLLSFIFVSVSAPSENPYHFTPKKPETILSYHNQNRWNFKMQTVRISEGKGTYSGRKKRVSRCVQAGWVISLQGGMKPDLCSSRTANAEKAGIPLFTVTLCPVSPPSNLRFPVTPVLEPPVRLVRAGAEGIRPPDPSGTCPPWG